MLLLMPKSQPAFQTLWGLKWVSQGRWHRGVSYRAGDPAHVLLSSAVTPVARSGGFHIIYSSGSKPGVMLPATCPAPQNSVWGRFQLWWVRWRTSPVSGLKLERRGTLKGSRDFAGGPVVKKPPANAGDMGSNPGQGISHMMVCGATFFGHIWEFASILRLFYASAILLNATHHLSCFHEWLLWLPATTPHRPSSLATLTLLAGNSGFTAKHSYPHRFQGDLQEEEDLHG